MKYPITILLCAVSLLACAGRNSNSNSNGRAGTNPSDGSKASANAAASAASQPEPVVHYGYRVVNSYPHDPEAYTQGLFMHEGSLWESTGEYGASSLRLVELETGRVISRRNLSDDYFAEGAALTGGRIYQLTWLEERVFVYDAATLERTGEAAYRGEGWGLTTDGEKLYMSDGSANITVRDPETFRTLATIAVLDDGRALRYINELEWIDGKIWANVYMTDSIVIIDPETGRVEGIIDFTGISSLLEITPSTDVMNGIAYDPATGRIFVTGKNWNRLFEIETFKK